MIADSEHIYGGENAIFTTVMKTDTLTDDRDYVNQLIAECPHSKDALGKLYDMFRKSVFALAFSITSDYHLSEDCVIETFVRLTQAEHFNPRKGDGRGFIHKIARNVAMELYRSYKTRKTDFFIQSYGEADKTVEDSIFINQLLKHLNMKQRQIVIMKVCSGLTFKEIARIMVMPESTVKSRYHKAMDILKEKAGVKGE